MLTGGSLDILLGKQWLCWRLCMYPDLPWYMCTCILYMYVLALVLLFTHWSFSLSRSVWKRPQVSTSHVHVYRHTQQPETSTLSIEHFLKLKSWQKDYFVNLHSPLHQTTFSRTADFQSTHLINSGWLRRCITCLPLEVINICVYILMNSS